MLLSEVWIMMQCMWAGLILQRCTTGNFSMKICDNVQLGTQL